MGIEDSNLKINCVSFGYKYGPINESNLLFDVRCLPNPFYVEELRFLSGLDSKVSDYILQFESSKQLSEHILSLILYILPLYAKKGNVELTIAVGCTGGKHRSVTFAELIYKSLAQNGYNVSVKHRDINK